MEALVLEEARRISLRPFTLPQVVGARDVRIRINTVNPVVTLTPMAEKVWSEPAKSAPMLARIPLQRFVQPDEVARAIAYLLSRDSNMVNGVSLAVDGGFQAG